LPRVVEKGSREIAAAQKSIRPPPRDEEENRTENMNMSNREKEWKN